MTDKASRGRPPKQYPPKVDASAEDIAKAMFRLSQGHQWAYLEEEPEDKCVRCGKPVHYPDTRYQDGTCAGCHI